MSENKRPACGCVAVLLSDRRVRFALFDGGSDLGLEVTLGLNMRLCK